MGLQISFLIEYITFDIVCTFWNFALALLPLILPMMFRTFLQQGSDENKSPMVIEFHTMILTIGSRISLRLVDNMGNDKTMVSCNMCSNICRITKCDVKKIDDNNLTLNINSDIILNIEHSSCEEEHMYHIRWETSGNINSFQDSFNMQYSHWYGVGHVFHHYWPMEKWNTAMGAMVTGEEAPFGLFGTYYGGIQERIWLSSTGVGLHVHREVPLFASINHNNDHNIKIKACYASPYHNDKNRKLSLAYDLLQTENVKQLTVSMHKHFFRKPSQIPCEQIFEKPIWSTWAEYKKAVNETKVLEFAGAIDYYGFEAAQIEIDDDWTAHYGQMEFDDKKFPNPKAMINSLKAMGFKVSLWVHPFVSPLSKTFKQFRKARFLLTGRFGTPSLFHWWNGYAGLIDFTNEEASNHFIQSLQNLKNAYGVDTFKIDAGEVFNFTKHTKSAKPLPTPNDYTTTFIETVCRSDTTMRGLEARTAYQNQSLPMFFRLQDKNSNWGYFNGLRTVISHVLTLGLLGYPFVLPDMIGGNGHPDRELFIRWIQLSTLMPAMQFSIPPWKFDPEVIVIARRMCQLRKKYAGKIVQLAKESTVTGHPICRPVWWIAPTDEVALTIDSQFLLGDEMLVAPIVENGARSRDVYLPPGKWLDGNGFEELDGGKWHKNYWAGLADLPHFILQQQ